MSLNVPGSIKRSAYKLLDSLGVNALFRKRNRQMIRFLTVHGIGDYSRHHNWTPLRNQLDIQDFRRFLNVLLKHFTFISIGEAVAAIKGQLPCPDHAIVLTFDDGYASNFNLALPVMEELGVPGVFYVATGLVDSSAPYWFDRLDYILQVAARRGVEFEVAGRVFKFDSDERDHVASVYARLRLHCKSFYNDDEEFAQVLDGLAKSLECRTGTSLASIFEGDPWASVVSSATLRGLHARPIASVGSHTVNHVRLKFASYRTVRSELVDSKLAIESWTGQLCEDFAFPSGAYDDVSVEHVKRAGYRSSVTSDFGFNRVGDDLFRLKRQSIAVGCTDFELSARVSGLEGAVRHGLGKIRRTFRHLQK